MRGIFMILVMIIAAVILFNLMCGSHPTANGFILEIELVLVFLFYLGIRRGNACLKLY